MSHYITLTIETTERLKFATKLFGFWLVDWKNGPIPIRQLIITVLQSFPYLILYLVEDYIVLKVVVRLAVLKCDSN